MDEKTYSVALHVRRVIFEDAYVAVPITEALIKRDDDGTGTINFEAFVAEAIRVSQSEKVDWQVEESHVETHPVQGPLPEGRQRFDAFYSQPDLD